MRLAQFIRQRSTQICAEWETFAATRSPAADTMTLADRRDHVVAILRWITGDLASAQTSDESKDKAQGKSDAEPGESTAAMSHGVARARSGYTPDQMVSEFRALRGCIVRLWLEDLGGCDRAALDDLTRFHEAIDQALAESVLGFSEDVNRAKDLFLGVLGHDLRTPLGVVMMGATLLLTAEGADWPHASTASRILRSGTRMEDMIRDLLDFTRGGLGGGIPITRSEVDLDELARLSIDELSAFHSGRSITLASDGPVIGMWDRGRLGQVLANLIGNAVQHGAAGEPIEVTVRGTSDAASIAIHNKGPMIPPQHLHSIFEPFRRLGADVVQARSGSVGLGLYIAKAIVTAHRGTIEVTSTEAGTTFTVQLARDGPARKV